jgi:DNA invertase Pin-like site-specific DNA recombinase
MAKELSVRKRIGNFIDMNPNFKPSEVANHFELEGILKRTTFNIVRRLKSGVGVDRTPGSGQNRAIDQKIKTKIVKFCANKVGISYRAIGRKFSVNHSTVKKILTEGEVIRKNRKKCPAVTENQFKKQKKCLNVLRKTLFKAKNNVKN